MHKLTAMFKTVCMLMPTMLTHVHTHTHTRSPAHTHSHTNTNMRPLARHRTESQCSAVEPRSDKMFPIAGRSFSSMCVRACTGHMRTPTHSGVERGETGEASVRSQTPGARAHRSLSSFAATLSSSPPDSGPRSLAPATTSGDQAAPVDPARYTVARAHTHAHGSHPLTIAWIHAALPRLEVELTVMQAFQSPLRGQ